MKINQVYDIVNKATEQATGATGLLKEDLSNIVDVGDTVIGAQAVDGYVKALMNHIGKVVFVNREYTSSVPSVLMDSWEFGSVVEKIRTDMPEAQENDSWKLEDGQEYKQDIFYQPKVEAKFFNSKSTFEVPMSFTELQVKQSFSNGEQLNGFLSMIENAIARSLSVKLDELVMRTINNMTAETLAKDLAKAEGSGLDTTKGSAKAVNLLAEYNANAEVKLTKENALQSPEFIRYASYRINLYTDRLSRVSTLFNVGGKQTFTPKEDLNVVLLSDFASASKAYLESDTYNNELVSLPNAETVPYWQGTGVDYALTSASKISVKTSGSETHVTVDGILGVMFDKFALGVANLDQRVTTHVNARAEFYNNFYKVDAGYFNDLNENFVVFFIG